MENNKKIHINYEIFSSPFTLMFKTKVQKIPKLQMEHFQNLIVDLNITQEKKNILIGHFITIIYLNSKMFVQILLIWKNIKIH
jgi:hypothetical protein